MLPLILPIFIRRIKLSTPVLPDNTQAQMISTLTLLPAPVLFLCNIMGPAEYRILIFR